MREYATELMLLCLFLSVAARLLYDRRYEGAMGLLCSLVLLSAVATPLASVDAWRAELSLPEISVGNDALTEELTQAYAEGIARALVLEFGYEEDDVRVAVTALDPERVQEAEVRVFLSGRAALADRRAVGEYLREGGVVCVEVAIEA